MYLRMALDTLPQSAALHLIAWPRFILLKIAPYLSADDARFVGIGSSQIVSAAMSVGFVGCFVIFADPNGLWALCELLAFLMVSVMFMVWFR